MLDGQVILICKPCNSLFSQFEIFFLIEIL